jgi:integral membrane sensor domain MASE1
VLFRVVTERTRITRTARSAPVPRPRVVDVCAALAGLGFGAVLAAVITGESAGALRAPGGLLTAVGRFAGFRSWWCW